MRNKNKNNGLRTASHNNVECLNDATLVKACKVYSLLKEEDELLTAKTLNLYLNQFRCPHYEACGKVVTLQEFAANMKDFYE